MKVTKEQTEQILYWCKVYAEKMGIDQPGIDEISEQAFFFGALSQLLGVRIDEINLADLPPAVAMCLQSDRPLSTVYAGRDYPKFIMRSRMSEDSPGTEPHCIVLRDISSEVGTRYVVHLYTPANHGFHNGTYLNDPSEVMQAYLDRCKKVGLSPF